MKKKGSTVQIPVWTPNYYEYLYYELLKEIRYVDENTDLLLPVRKWKKDILLLLLEHSKMSQTNRKVFRKRVTGDLRKIYDNPRKEVLINA